MNTMDTMEHRKATVLVVEDHEAVRNLLRVILQSRGFDVVGALSVDDAIGHARAGGVNAVVTDWTIPNGGGERLVLELAKDGQTNRIPVVVTSGAVLPDLSYYPNVAATLAKPFDLATLCDTLEELC